MQHNVSATVGAFFQLIQNRDTNYSDNYIFLNDFEKN